MRASVSENLNAPIVAASAGAAEAKPLLHKYDNGVRTSAYEPLGGERSDADLQAAVRACDARVGAPENGSSPGRDYQQCMQQQGWRHRYTMMDGNYLDRRHPGSVCHDFLFMGVVGQSCSNFD